MVGLATACTGDRPSFPSLSTTSLDGGTESSGSDVGSSDASTGSTNDSSSDASQEGASGDTATDSADTATSEGHSDDSSSRDVDTSDSMSTGTLGETSDAGCTPDTLANCASVHGEQGVCGQWQLICSDDGTWPQASECQQQATSEDCTTDVDENCDGEVNEAASCPCADNPCQNDGVCQPTATSDYSCDCSADFMGTHCESRVSIGIEYPPETTRCEMVAVSDDGQVIAANCEDASGQHGYFWEQTEASGGTWRKATFASGYERATLSGLSADGAMASGNLWDPTDGFPARWASTAEQGALLLNGTQTSSISADGAFIAGANEDNKVVRWSGANRPAVYDAEWSASLNVTISPNGQTLASSSDSTRVLVWTSPSSVSSIANTSHAVKDVVAVSDDGTEVVGTTNAPVSQVFTYSEGTWTLFEVEGALYCDARDASADLTKVLGDCSGAGSLVWIDEQPYPLQELVADAGIEADFDSSYRPKISPNGQFVIIAASEKLVRVGLP